MSRYKRATSYGHAIERIGVDHYRLSWTIDRYYPDSRLRRPQRATRDTDEAGAQRFCKRWDIDMPVVQP